MIDSVIVVIVVGGAAAIALAVALVAVEIRRVNRKIAAVHAELATPTPPLADLWAEWGWSE